MRLSLFIAFRYLFSKKRINAINVITMIASVGFGVGAFAMIVILSTFNGFENLVEGLINNYDPDIKITAAGKKVSNYSAEKLGQIAAIEGVDQIVPILEEKVVLKYKNKQEIAKIQGVGKAYNTGNMDSLMVMGDFDLGDTSRPFAVFGAGLSSRLSLFPNSQMPVSIYVPKRNVAYSALNPEASLSTRYIRVSGLFAVHEDIDNETFITSIDFARELLDYQTEVSALHIKLSPDVEVDVVQESINSILDAGFVVQNRKEQNELLYKIFRSEKWFTYAILSLVLVISSFNIFGSLIMLVLDKKKDIGILKSMGADDKVIRRTFLWQGNYIATFGGLIGIILALLLVAGQQKFGWLQMENSIVDAYPVEIVWTDVLLTAATVIILGLLISIYPANKAGKVKVQNLN